MGADTSQYAGIGRRADQESLPAEASLAGNPLNVLPGSFF
jgi:hypothetical protein